jgi:hypothetical protein
LSPAIEEGKRVWPIKISWKLYFQCVAWGAVIEAPLLAWFVSEQGYLNVSALFVALFHMPGYLLAYPLIAPFHHRTSTMAEIRSGYSLLFFFQTIVIGTVIYIYRRKEVLPSDSDPNG